MALIDIDRHILLELAILSKEMIESATEFKRQWETITSVRVATELIVLGEKNAEHPQLPKLRDQIVKAMKTCNTKMIFMDDRMSKQAALLNHLVSEVKDSDTRKGLET